MCETFRVFLIALWTLREIAGAIPSRLSGLDALRLSRKIDLLPILANALEAHPDPESILDAQRRSRASSKVIPHSMIRSIFVAQMVREVFMLW